jgi:capsular polysaccharide biosynthesis protein
MSLRYTSPEELPGLLKEDVTGRRPAAGAWTENPGRVRRMLRYAPEFIVDPSGTGIFSGIGPDVYRSPPVVVTAVNDAQLVGYRTVISGGTFCNDEILLGGAASLGIFLDKLAAADPFLNEQTGLRRVESERFVLDTAGRVERHFPDCTVVLCSHEPGNYGSLLFRVLPKLIAARQLGLLDLPMIAWAWPKPFQRLLELCGVAPSRLIQHDLDTITHLDRALMPSLRNPNAFLDSSSHAMMQALADQFEPEQLGRRIYVSRLKHGQLSGSTRIMLNEDKLAERLADLAFEIIEPERLTTEEQIATFASADIVVGPSGSAMFNTVFCRPGTKVVDIESEPNWIYAHTGLFASCQLRYGLFVGSVDPADSRPVHRRWTVDIDPLMDCLSGSIRA